MAVPASIAVAVAALGDDFGSCLRRLAALAFAVLVVPLLVAAIVLAALVALVRGGVDAVPASQALAGGGVMRGGPPSAVALVEIPADQLAFMQQVSASSSCGLSWTVLAAIASIESGFGRTADQFSSAEPTATVSSWKPRGMPTAVACRGGQMTSASGRSR